MSVAKSDEIGKIATILPISSLLATLVTIPVLLTRLFGKSLVKGLFNKVSRDFTPNEMCDFTDFVTFSNAWNDTCFVNQIFWYRKAWLRVCFVTFSNARNNTCFVNQTLWYRKAWLRVCLTKSRETLHQTRCAILPILSLLATLRTIPVLLTRLFGTEKPG